MLKVYQKHSKIHHPSHTGVQSPYNRVGWMRLFYDIWHALIRRKILVFSLLFLLVTLPIFLLVTKYKSKVEAAWMDDAWSYRKAVAIPSHTTLETNVYVTVPTFDATDTSKFQADCGDLRFTKQNGELLPYYVVDCDATANIHVQFDTLPAGASTYFMYYGNPSVANGFSSADFSTAATGLGTQVLASEEKSAGPVAYWKFDEGYGTAANNSTSVSGINGASTDVVTNSAQTNFLINFPSYNTYKKIHDSISTNTDVVTNYPGETTTYTRGVDYEIDYPTGRMRILSTGSMTISTNYLIDSTYSNTGVTWQTEDQCISGKCLYFDGADDSIQVTANPSLSMGPSKYITMQAWVKRVDDVNADNSSGGIITHNYYNPRIITSGNAFIFYLGFADQTRSVSTASSYPAGKWYFVSATWDGTYLKIYVNGVLSATSSDYSAYTVTTTQAVYYIGRTQSGITRGILHGYIDEPKVYSYARTLAQIKSDFLSKGSGSVKGTAASLGSSAKNKDAFSNGLVGYWKMDEASWTQDCSTASVIDSSGNGLNGKSCESTTGPAGGAVGKFGNSGDFDGSDDNVTVADNTLLQAGTVWSAAAWFKLDTTGSDKRIIDKTNNGTGYALIVSSTTPQFITGNGSTYDTLNGTSTLATGTWYYIVGTVENGVKKIYINGNLENTASITFNGVGAGVAFRIGTRNATTQTVDGKIDEARIYNRALSPKEVRDLYAWAPGPVGYWNMDEKTGQTVNDISGNGLSATLGVNSSANTDDPTWTTGKFGAGLSFDGGDYVSRGTGPTIVNSVSFWTYPTSTTNYFVDLNGSAYISATSGTLSATGFTSPTIYVNGAVSSTIVASQWQYITVTTATNLNASALNFGKISSNYMTGKLDDVKIYNYVRTSKQIVEDMNAGHPLGGSPVGSQVGYWKFNEGYGQTSYDSTINVSNGTLGSTTGSESIDPTWSQNGKFGKALVFDGVDDIITVGNINSLNVQTGDFTISAWIYTGTGGGIILSKDSCGDANQYYLALSGLSPQLRVTNSAVTTFYNTAIHSISANSWSYITGVKRGNQTEIYINGKLDKTVPISGTFNSSTLPVWIGNRSGRSNPSCNVQFGGLIDEVKIYSAALTADEIKLDYNRGSAMVLGTMSDTSGLSGGSVASGSASAAYCIPGDTTSCNPPVGEWNFEEKTGSNTYDTSGNNNTGTMVGFDSSQWTTGKVGAALQFDATDSEINLASEITLAEDTPWTIEYWFYQTAGTTNKMTIGKTDTNYNRFYHLTSGTIVRVHSNDGSTFDITLGSDTRGAWHHLSVVNTAAASNNILSYLDGKLIDTDSMTNTLFYINNIGNPYTGTSYIWDGKLDQVRVFNYARTPAQIAWDYNRGGPVGWWKMDECQGITANDSSGNGNTGTITIGATGTNTTAGTCTGSAGEAWKDGAIGKYNSSLEFDGTDDYVNVGSYSSLNNVGDNISVSAWVKTSVGSGLHTIVGRGNDWRLNKSGNVYQFEHRNSSNVIVYPAGTNTSTDWVHVVGTYARDTFAKLYINGVLVDSDAQTLSTRVSQTQNQIGNNYAWHSGDLTYNDYWWDGQIDDVKIFNYALTSNQVKTLYNQGSSIRFGPATGSP